MSTQTAAQIDAFLNFLEEHRNLTICGKKFAPPLALWAGALKQPSSGKKCGQIKSIWQKRAAMAARRSATAIGSGPSTAPSLSQWGIKVISTMGDGFGGPQTSARVPAFVEDATRETSTSSSTQPHQDEDLFQINAKQKRREYRRRSADRSVRDRLFTLKERPI